MTTNKKTSLFRIFAPCFTFLSIIFLGITVINFLIANHPFDVLTMHSGKGFYVGVVMAVNAILSISLAICLFAKMQYKNIFVLHAILFLFLDLYSILTNSYYFFRSILMLAGVVHLYFFYMLCHYELRGQLTE